MLFYRSTTSRLRWGRNH